MRGVVVHRVRVRDMIRVRVKVGLGAPSCRGAPTPGYHIRCTLASPRRVESRVVVSTGRGCLSGSDCIKLPLTLHVILLRYDEGHGQGYKVLTLTLTPTPTPTLTLVRVYRVWVPMHCAQSLPYP